MFRYLIWGKRIPRKIVFVTGLYTILYPVYDCTYSLLAQKLTQREPFDLQNRYGANTLAVVAGATSDTGKAICDKLKQNGF